MSAGYDFKVKLLWRGADQVAREISLFRLPFVFGTGLVMDAAGGKFGGGCIHGNGASTSVAIASSDLNATHNLGSNDFYISAWVNTSGANFNTSRQVVLSKASGVGVQSFMFGIIPGTGVLFYYQTVGGTSATESELQATGLTFTSGTWYHIACSRSGGTVRLFLNGTLVGSTLTAASTFATTQPLRVGGYDVPSFTYPFNGLLNDVQLIVGDSVHTANFTPETDYIVPPVGPIAYARHLKSRIVPGATRGAYVFKLLHAPAHSWDTYFNGRFKIVGTVKEFNTPTNTPLHRKVSLLVEPTLRCLAMTWSNASTGAYEFHGLTNAYKYTVLAHDYTNNYRAVVGDRQTAEAM